MTIAAQQNKMDYRKVKYEDKAIEIQISSFTGKGVRQNIMCCFL